MFVIFLAQPMKIKGPPCNKIYVCTSPDETDNTNLNETAKQGSLLTVFPECALTGYCFDSLEEAMATVHHHHMQWSRHGPGVTTCIANNYLQQPYIGP